MKKSVSLLSVTLNLLVLFVLSVIISGCLPQPIPTIKITNRKVIISHLGELTRDTRYVGDVIRYKVYYLNESKQKADIGIMDKLDPNLSQVSAFNNGNYDKQTHAITWRVESVAPGKGGFVEFEAVIGETDSIMNKARIVIGELPEKMIFDSLRVLPEKKKEIMIETNMVTTIVCPPPKLGWIPFDKEFEKAEPPRSDMKDETTTGLMLNFGIPGMFVHEVRVNNVIYHRLSIPGHATLMNVGKPELPIVGQIVEVPHGVNLKIEIVKSKSINLKCYNVYPAQEPEIRQPKPKEKTFALNKVAYLTEAYYPAELAEIKAEDIGVIRGHRIVFLKVYPVQYNPVTREIKAFSQIEVRLKYDRPAQIQPVDRRIQSTAFEELLQVSVLNYKGEDRFPRSDNGRYGDEKERGCDYLIITHGDFYNANDVNNPVVQLQDWKQRKGLHTMVVDVDDIPAGNTAADIRDYIQDAYDTWHPPPTYVLLVGDTEFIPTNYQTWHSDHNCNIGTDLRYVTVDGTDYFPDIFIGRLSVENSTEAENVIDKILNYENNPPVNANFYANTSLVCLFEDVSPSDGQEDWSFRIIEFAEEIRTHLQNNGYNCARIYDASGNFPQGPQRYENGTNLPANLTIAGGFPWNGATADITNAITNGNFIITYDGHGLPDLWDRPGFSNANVDVLANDPLNPVVFSLACMTGWFDNETDGPNEDTDPNTPGNQTTAFNDECFCEHFLRRANGGAVAIIGATRISWDNNDFMMLGMFKAIWPEFDPNPPFGPGTLPEMEMGPLVRMGQINTFSKVYMANYYTDDGNREASFEMYTLFGDPEMPVWTEEPARLEVEHPKGIGSAGEQDFVVKVEDDPSGDPVQSAWVVLTHNGEIISRMQTNPDGIARFTLNSPASGELDITVTSLNYRPYEGKIDVSAGGAVVNRLEPDNGVEKQTVYVGGQNFSGDENVDIYFGAQHMKIKAATGGSFGQSGVEDVDIQVPSPYELGPVNVSAEGQSSNRHAVDVFRVRTANPIDLYTYCQWDNTTWHLQPGGELTWNNPEIQLYDQNDNPVASNNLTVGHTYTIEAKIHNDTGFDAPQVRVTFKWANFGLGQADNLWYDIDTDHIDVPANTDRKARASWAPPSTGHLCLLAEIYNIEDINESNNRGQENCDVGPTTSPDTVSFFIWNPTDKPSMVFLELRQLIPPREEEEQRLWGTWIRHPDPQVIGPGETREAEVIINPDVAKAEKGEQAEFALTGFINGKIIGGVNFIVTKR